MRYRATAAIAVASGAMALAAAAMPAAQAAGPVRPEAQPGAHAVAPDINTTNTMNVTFSNVSVDNGASSVAAGTTNAVHVPYTYTLTATGVDPTKDFSTSLDLYRGPVAQPLSDLSGDNAHCTHASAVAGSDTAVTESCSGTVDVDPHSLTFDDAGAAWHAVAYAYDSATGGWAQHGTFAAPTLKRWAVMTVHATPEPVAKGATITITGALTRASWDTHAYWGYAGQSVKLQFRPQTSGTYTTLKTVTTDSSGDVRATEKSTVPGFWRWSFAGTSTTVASTPAGFWIGVH